MNAILSPRFGVLALRQILEAFIVIGAITLPAIKP